MSTLASLFRDTNRRAIERLAGRIEKVAGHWELAEPSPEVKASLEAKDGRHTDMAADGSYILWSKTVSGQYMRLVKGPATWCRNPELLASWAEVKPGVVSVKMTACRKCKFYRKASRQYRYPTCAQRANPNPKRAAAQEFIESFNEAVKDVNEIMGK